MVEDSLFGNPVKGTRETIILAKRRDSEPITITKASITKGCGKTVDSTAMGVFLKRGIKFIRGDGWMDLHMDSDKLIDKTKHSA
jgi:hypothetical protein